MNYIINFFSNLILYVKSKKQLLKVFIIFFLCFKMGMISFSDDATADAGCVLCIATCEDSSYCIAMCLLFSCGSGDEKAVCANDDYIGWADDLDYGECISGLDSETAAYYIQIDPTEGINLIIDGEIVYP